MPVGNKLNAGFAAAACSVLGAWVVLIVGAVSTRSIDTDRVAPIAPKATMASLGIKGAGLSGPLDDRIAKRLHIGPTLTHLRLSQTTGRGLFAGRGAPNARLVLLRGGRAVADTRVNENGDWQIATAMSDIAGAHDFGVEQRIASGDYIAGESIRLHVPDHFRQTINVVKSEPRNDFQLVAVRAESEDIGTASSRKFDELLRDGRLEGGERTAERRVVERSDGLLEPAWSWLRNANRSYHDEIVPRIKRGGGSAGGAGRTQDTERKDPPRARQPVERMASNTRDDESIWPDGGASWMPSGIVSWMTAARRGYATEIVPRLSGRVPPTITARVRDTVNEAEETQSERERRLARERSLERDATEKAEQERLDAARRRREAELRRQTAEEEARRLAEERRLTEIEEARKLAEERRRVLERRAEQQRLAQAEAEEAQRKAREAELARQQEAAEKEALERQRLADLEREKREAENRRGQTDEADQERKRQAALDLRQRERAREEAEQRRLAQEQRDRLIAQAIEIKRREAAARDREAARERERAQAEALRREQRTLVAELQRKQREREEELAREQRERALREREARRRQLALAERRAREADERDRNEARTAQPPRRERTAQTRLQDLSRFKRRDTEIEITTSGRGADRAEPPRSRAIAKRVASRRPKAKRRRRLTRAQRRRAVRGYRRRTASARHARGRCHRRAGRRINPPGTYIVKRGDSLWRISKRHYRLGRYFRMIHRANRRKIRRARLIYPCQRFLLPRRT